MKKFILFAALCIASAAVSAQDAATPRTPATGGTIVHDRAGTAMLQAPRIRAHVAPNPMSTRAAVDAGGAVIREIIITTEEGRLMRHHTGLNVVRFDVERPGLDAGLHIVEVITDFGATRLKMMVE